MTRLILFHCYGDANNNKKIVLIIIIIVKLLLYKYYSQFTQKQTKSQIAAETAEK